MTWYFRISIHSLRVEGDQIGLISTGRIGHFNPLPPCGGRHDLRERIDERHISIHSLRVEGDSKITQLSA